MSKDVLPSAQGKENKSLYMSQLNMVNHNTLEENQRHAEEHRHSIDYSKVFLFFFLKSQLNKIFIFFFRTLIQIQVYHQ
jgi:hypothetical protein